MTDEKRKRGRPRTVNLGDHGVLPKAETNPTIGELISTSRSWDRAEAFKELTDEITELPKENDDDDIPEIAKTLSGKQRIAVRMLSQGIQRKVISNTIGYADVTITNIVQSEAGRAYFEYLSKRLDALHDTVANLMQQNSIHGAIFLIETVQDKNADSKLRAQCAMDLLDRTGHKAATTTNLHVSTDSITKEDLDKLNKADDMFLEIKQLGPGDEQE